MNILALEVGTAQVSAAVLDVATGQLVGGIARVHFSSHAPVPGAVEVLPQHLWNAVTDAAHQAVQKSGVAGQTGSDIAGLGLTTFAGGLLLLDKKDEPLGPIWMPTDSRARPAARQAWAHVGEEFQAAIGVRPVPTVTALAYRQQLSVDPYVSHRATSYLHVNGWLAFRMTGVKAFDPGQASMSGLLTLTEPTWSQRWCDYFEIERAWLPPIFDGSATVGTIRADVAVDLAVPAGIPVKLGSDTLASAILAHPMEPGDVLHEIDGLELLASITDTPTVGTRRWTRRRGVGPGFVHVTTNAVGTRAIMWLYQLCFRDQPVKEFLEVTTPLAAQRETRIVFEPPFLDGDVLENEACRAAFRDLESSTDRLDLLTAMIKAIRQRHAQALADLGQKGPWRRVYLSNAADAPLLRRLLPGYDSDRLILIENGPLRGVARLFA